MKGGARVKQKKITDFLSTGESQAVSLDELSLSTGLREAAVKSEILKCRIAGELILSSPAGYYLPNEPDEIRRYVRQRQTYLKTAHAALRPFLKAMQET